MTKLFLSHASEDKDEFVRPLAEALKSDFEVWYDEYELVLGDSLLGKISDGLSKCDYGVVVLSRHFFLKRWPKSELDGLFSLETAQRKVILPIWKDVSEEDVKVFSPILAGRLGVSADSGIEKIIQEIKRAVGITERVRGLQQSQWKQKFASIADDINFKKKVTDLAHSTRGVEQVTVSAKSILSSAQDRAFDLNRTHPEFQLRVFSDEFRPNLLIIRGLGQIMLRFRFWVVYANSIDESCLEVALFKDDGNFLGFEQDPIDSSALHPDFDRELNVCWKDDARLFSDEEAVLDFAYDMLAKALARLIERTQR